jgi:hypothetical protein
MKIKEWPIIMTCSLQYWSAILPFYALDQLKYPEVVDSNDTGNDEARVIFFSFASTRTAMANGVPSLVRVLGFMNSPAVRPRM